MFFIVTILKSLIATSIFNATSSAIKTCLPVKSYFLSCSFADINMPVMDGYEAAKRIRKSNKKDAQTVPIYAMTANAFAEDVTNALNAGMNGHLAKPIETKVLYSVLDQLWKK